MHHARRRRLARHRCWSGSIRLPAALDLIRTGETRSMRENGTATFVPPIRPCKSACSIDNTRRRSVYVVSPVFDQLVPLLRIGRLRCLCCGKFSRQEPLEGQSEKELDEDNGQNED